MSKKDPIDEALGVDTPPDIIDVDHKVVEESSIKRKKPTEIQMSDSVRKNKRIREKNTDYAETRDNLKGIIDQGMNALDGIVDVAKNSDSPRAYEVVSQLVKSVTEANKDLIDLHRLMNDLDEADGTDATAKNVTNNAFFIGSTKELQKVFKDMKDSSNGDNKRTE